MFCTPLLEGGGGWSWKFWEFEVFFQLPWRTKKGKGETIFPLLTEHGYDLETLLCIPVYSVKLLISSMKQHLRDHTILTLTSQ
jgi:hypothetical protein